MNYTKRIFLSAVDALRRSNDFGYLRMISEVNNLFSSLQGL